MVASLIPEKKSKLPKIEVYAVRLDRQGYDRHGRYFGVGEKLWNWYDDRGYGRDEYIRAPTQIGSRSPISGKVEDSAIHCRGMASTNAVKLRSIRGTLALSEFS